MFAILIPVGPDAIEPARVVDLIQSIVAHEPSPGEARIVLLDDGPSTRDLSAMVAAPAGYSLTMLRHPRHALVADPFPRASTLGSLGAGLLAALAWLQSQATKPRFVLKLDTDALVIAPFVRQIERALSNHPSAGMIGAHRFTPLGTIREIAHHGPIMRRLHVPPLDWSSPTGVVRSSIRRVRSRLNFGSEHSSNSKIRACIGEARSNGYTYGEHCLGAAYVLSGEMIARLAVRGVLSDPLIWMDADCGEDVLFGMLAYCVGLHLADAVRPGEPFGVRHIGLAAPPEQLLRRGYSIIHSLKNDARFGETELRTFFRAARN